MGTPQEDPHLLVFSLDGDQYGIHLDAVIRVVQMVEITRLPEAPESILGVIDVGGEIVPVIDVRQKVGAPAREIEISDHLILAQNRERCIALAVDTIEGVVEPGKNNLTASSEIGDEIGSVEGVYSTEKGMVLIEELDTLLPHEDHKTLEKAISSGKK